MKLGIDVVTIPVDVGMDIITLGGTVTDQDKPYLVQKLDQMREDAEEADR